MTLDQDDVNLARQWLQKSDCWYDDVTVRHYQECFARWNGSRFAFAFMGGRVALSACIHALGLKSGDEAIVPAYTCVVVPNAFEFAGVQVVYTDIELDTYGLDVDQVRKNITSKTSVILLHHLYGLVCRDYEAILQLARQHRIRVIEDCAQATGALYFGTKVGNQGDMAIYSTEHSKVFYTGQGGLAATNDEGLAAGLSDYYERAPQPDPAWIDRQLHQVILDYYTFKDKQPWWRAALLEARFGAKRTISTTPEEEQGMMPIHYGRRMCAAIAAVGLNQLGKIEKYNAERRHNAVRWDSWCQKHKYSPPLVLEYSSPVFLRYPLLVSLGKKHDRTWTYKTFGLDVGLWFITNVHPARRPVFNCPKANKAVAQCINLPTLGISDEQLR